MREAESYPRRVARGTSIVFSGSIAALGIGLLLRVFLARSLNVADYGLFFAIFAIFSLLRIFPNLGFNTTLVKNIPELLAKKQLGRLKSSMALVAILQAGIAGVICFGIFLLANQIASAIPSLSIQAETAASFIRILCIWFFAWVLLYLLRSIFAGFQNMLFHTGLELLYISIVLSSAVAFMGLLGLGFGSVPWAYAIGSAVAATVAFVLLSKKYSFALREKITINKELFKRLLKFALPIFLSVIAGIVMANMDTFLIAVFRSPEEVGFYQTARPIARILWYFPLSLSTVLLPMISELWAKEKVKYLCSALNRLIKFSFILVISPVLITLIFPDIIINLLFGPRYLECVMALRILSLTAIFFMLQSIGSSVIIGVGKPILQTRVVLVMVGFNLIGNLLLIPLIGIEGAAITAFFSYVIGFGLTTRFAKKLVKFSVPVIPLLKTIVGAIITAIVLFLMKWIIVLPPLIELFVVAAPCLLLYIVWVLATILTIEDLRVLRETGIPSAGLLAALWKKLHKQD